MNDHSSVHLVQSGAVSIDLVDCSVSYRGDVAVQAASVAIPANQITAIVGPSGCGKTSMLRAINRMNDLISGCRVSGSILVNNQDIYAPGVDVTDLRRRIGMIFQQPNPFPTSIFKNLAFALKTRGVLHKPDQMNKIEDLLCQVGLWDQVKDRLHGSALALSGGQQQRLCIARALAVEPEAILMDEPCSSLDPMATEVVEKLMLELRQSYTVVVVTHNLAQARRIADHLAVCWTETGCGCVIESGIASQVFDKPQNQVTEAFLSGTYG